MTERLWIVRDDDVIADLDRDADGRLRLQFRPQVVARPSAVPLISVSLPVRAEPYNEKTVASFFDGVLPEGLVRERLATRFRLDPNDVFGLLHEFGRDCAGALVVIPEGEDLTAARTGGVRWLTEVALAETVANLTTRPLANEPSEGIRISLAGTQNKTAVVVEGDRVGLPLGTTPSTHILKPASTERRSAREERLKYPSLVANEAFCSVLAGHVGLHVASISIRSIDGEPALLIERYDRSGSGANVTRVHQEDFCQALGLPRTRKYEADGGPSLADHLGLVQRTSVDVFADQPELLDRVAFNYLIGNDDAHAKNFSLLHGAGGSRLAPAYDLLSTFVYPDLKKEMATAINGMYDGRALQPVHWTKMFRQLHLSERLYSKRLVALAERVEAALPLASDQLHRWNLGNGTLEQLTTLVLRRVRSLKALASS